MSTRRRTDKKVELSFTNWVLGGSLLSVSSAACDVELQRQRRRSSGKTRAVVEVDSVCFPPPPNPSSLPLDLIRALYEGGCERKKRIVARMSAND
jgi:hypothetical protein